MRRYVALFAATLLVPHLDVLRAVGVHVAPNRGLFRSGVGA